MKKIKILLFLFLLLSHVCWAYTPPKYDEKKMYFVLVADEDYYSVILKTLGTIVEHNQDTLGQIAVFDLGFTPEQRESLNQMQFVHVYDIEPANPDIFTKFKVRNSGRTAKGWYSWKPVVIKQALDMFSAILFMDANAKVNKSLENLFQHIRKKGYLLIDCRHDIRQMTTKPIIDKFDLNDGLLEQIGLEAGFQGLSRAIYDDYVYPMYELAKDVKNFEDDGTAPLGFGWARHDQTLFSIYARLLNLEIKIRHKFFIYTNKNSDLKIDLRDYITTKHFKKNIKK